MTKKIEYPTIYCLQENLKAAISSVSHFVAARATLPVLSTILVAADAQSSRLKLSATNLETAITAWVGAKIEGPLAIAVPAKTFADVIHAIDGDELTLTLNARTWTLTIADGHYHNEIKGIDPAEFPVIPRVGEGATLPSAPLERAIRLTAFAAATDARPALSAVSFSMNGNGLTLAATDGFRLSRAIVPLPNLPALKALVPARALSALSSLLKQDDDVIAEIANNQIRFKFSAYEMIVQLIEGTFPNYENIIPKKSAITAAVDGDTFARACKAAHIFARENSDTARFAISPGNDTEPGRIAVSAQSAETGSGKAAVDAAVQGGALEIAFNVKLMLDALNAMRATNISLGLTVPTAPAILRDPDDENFLHMIMPMRLEK